MYAHLSPSFPSFLFPPFLCHLSRREGRVLYGSYLCWTGAARTSAKKSAWTGASWQGSLTNASWCLNPLSVCQRQKFGWLSVTFQLPPELKAQWQSGTSVYVMAFCFPLRILILFSFILWFSFPPSQPCSSVIQLLCYECPKFLLAISFIPKKSEVAQSCLTLCNPVDCSPQAPPSMGFSRQEYWSVLPLPSPGDLPDPGIEPVSLALQMDALLCGF